jgi:Ca2+-binding EF-hand superfamily protein
MLRSSQNLAAAYAVRSTLSDAELAQARTAFFETDRDGSGAIDRSELARMLKSLGQTPTKRMIEEIFIASYGGADANGKGKIELREFLNWYSKQLQKKNQTAQDDVRRAASPHAHARTHACTHTCTTACICLCTCTYNSTEL